MEDPGRKRGGRGEKGSLWKPDFRGAPNSEKKVDQQGETRDGKGRESHLFKTPEGGLELAKKSTKNVGDASTKSKRRDDFWFDGHGPKGGYMRIVRPKRPILEQGGTDRIKITPFQVSWSA